MLGASEDEHLMPVAVVDQMRQQVPLVIFRDAVSVLAIRNRTK